MTTATVGCDQLGVLLNGSSDSRPTRKISAVEMDGEGKWTVSYNDGGMVNLGLAKHDEADPTLAVEDGYWVVDGKKTEVKLKENEKFNVTYADSLKAATPLESYSTGRYMVASSNVSYEENENYNCKKFIVSPGQRYVASFVLQAKTVYGVLFLDGSGALISQMVNSRNGDNLTFNNVEVTVPENAVYMLINSRNDIEAKVSLVVREKIYRLGTEEATLRVGCFNCGQFGYADETNPLTTTEYATNWKTMLAAANCDLFAFEDVINTALDTSDITDANGFGAGVTPNEVLGSNAGTSMVTVGGVASCLRTAVKTQPLSVNIIPCDASIDGSTKTTARFYAMRLTYYIGEKLVAFYSLHLVAEGHISETPVNGGYSLSQQLRQKQFTQLIADTKNFDEAIIVGDFNAQVGSEYDIFAQNGFTMVNDGSIGTLRETLCADNIIVSSGISISSYEVIDDYVLNTDHLGLYADLSF